jgi:hypothetical protein
MSLQRLINMCSYSSDENKNTCPDFRTNSSCCSDPTICLNEDEGFCDASNPKELFQCNYPINEVRKIIEERLKQKT